MERQLYHADTLRDHIDALAQKFEASGIVGVYKNGETLLCEAYGFENREAQAPMRFATRFVSILKHAILWRFAFCCLRTPKSLHFRIK